MDEIQRKLQLFEKRLAGRWIVHSRVVSSAPMFFVAAGLILGITLQDFVAIHFLVWLAVLAFLVTAAAIFLMVGYRRGTIKPEIMAYTAMLCAVCLGAVRLASFNHSAANDIGNFVGQEQILAIIRGRIVTEPYNRQSEDWAFADFAFRQSSGSFYMELSQAEAVDGWVDVDGTVRVYVGEQLKDLHAGDYIEACCKLSRFRGATNPGQFDFADYLSKHNIYVGASIRSHEAIKVLREGGRGQLADLKNYIRQAVSGSLMDQGLDGDREKAMLEALLLGRRSNIAPEVYRAFERTGLLHFISLSGLHLGIFIGTVWWITARFGLSKPVIALVCIIMLTLFLMVVPPRAPTIRAALIAYVFFLAIFFRRYPNPLNSLAIAAVILLLIRPTNLFDAGWQLSFACVLGILMFCKRFYNYLNEKLFARDFWQKKKITRLVQKFGQGILGLFTTGITAWLGGAGILLYHFYTVDLLASVWTIIAFPFVALILWLGFAKILLSFIPGVAILLGGMLNAISWALIEIVELMSKLNFAHIIIGQVPVWVVLFYYGGIAVIVWAWYLRPFTRKIVITVTVLVMVGPVGFIKLHKMYPSDLQMTCLDVGHGQAVIVQSPGGTFLFDAGSLYKDNIGRWVVTPFLRSRGIGRLDAAVISHDDVDHFNGLGEIAKEYKIGSVYSSKAFINKYDESETVRQLTDCLKQQGITLQKLGEKIESSPRLKIDVIWPDEQAGMDKSLTDNNKSVVNLIEFAGRKILLCADIEEYAQQKLLGKNENLHADIVLVPHHGSIPNDGWKFLKSITADYLICSSSISSYERLQRARPDVNGQWFYTAKDGAIELRIRKDGNITVETFKD